MPTAAAAPATTPSDLPERRLRFEYPDDLRLGWNPVYPELACAANSISLLMPYVEPYFVRSIRATVPELAAAGGGLEVRTADYLRQELQHHVQHRRFNQLLAPQCRAIPRVERAMRRTFGWLGRTRSNRFSVAYAAASETIAFGIARWVDGRADTLLADADPTVSTLFLWHLAEEVEHKTAAYEVFEATDGSRLRYAAAGALSVAILAAFTIVSTFAQLWTLGRLRYPVTWFRLTWWGVSLAFTILPLLAASSLPGHGPSTLADPPYLRQWLRGVDPVTGTAPTWAPGGRRAEG